MEEKNYEGKLKYRIDFKTIGFSNNRYGSKEYRFNDERHFENWLNKQMKSNSWKIIGHERIYETEKEFSAEDLYQAFLAGKNSKFESFKDWTDLYFKREIN